MNKIFLIIVLIASSYGQAKGIERLGVGTANCSLFLDNSESADALTMPMFGSYAQGAFATMNTVSRQLFPDAKIILTFSPDTAVLRRVLRKHCDDNLTQNFHDAVLEVWIGNAK